MKTPTDNVIKRLLGMINFLAVHMPNVSIIIAFFHDLMYIHFSWGPEQTSTMTKVKEILSILPVLSYFDSQCKDYNTARLMQVSIQKDGILLIFSPAYPQSNGFVEGNEQTIKQLIKRACEEGRDKEITLLEFQNIPITGIQESPA